MDDLKSMSEATYNWLKQIPAVHWARSHFTGRAKTDVLPNNLCEVFNSRLVDGRDKPIITALKFVREYLMKRIVNVMKLIKKEHGFLTPTIQTKFEIIKNEAAKLTCKWNGGSKFQVTGCSGSQYVVDVVEKVCSCRYWELLGIPCKHAVAANWDMRDNSLEVDVPELWVDSCYWLETWKEVYSHKVGPINGRNMWPSSECPTPLKEPKYHKPIRRPRKMRKKDQGEKEDEMAKNGKLTRKWKSVTFSKCKKKGHNKKTCVGQVAESNS